MEAANNHCNIRGYGLESHLLGTHPRPEQMLPEVNGAPGRVNPEFVAWQRQDQLLASWLLSSISDGVLVAMVGNNTAAEMWETLELNFASQSKTRVM